ncbi:MAG: hypothetical protein ACLP59_11380 [Bryobacteraceae bacterium]
MPLVTAADGTPAWPKHVPTIAPSGPGAQSSGWTETALYSFTGAPDGATPQSAGSGEWRSL